VALARGFDKGSIRLPKRPFKLQGLRSVPLVSMGYDLGNPFTAVTRIQIPSGTPSLFNLLREATVQVPVADECCEQKITNYLRKSRLPNLADSAL